MAHFLEPSQNVAINFVRVFEGGSVKLQLWGGGDGGEELNIDANDPSIASVPKTPPPVPVGIHLREFTVNGVRPGNVMLEARDRAGRVWAFTQIIVFARPPMRLSAAGLRFIADHEGFVPRLYNDAAGHCTIGYGHLVHHGRCNGREPADFRAGITEPRALTLLRADVGVAERAVNSSVTVPLYQEEFDALVSFTFNAGGGALRGSTLLSNLNNRQYDTVPAELSRWVRAGGRQLPGLIARRNDEATLFRDRRY